MSSSNLEKYRNSIIFDNSCPGQVFFLIRLHRRAEDYGVLFRIFKQLIINQLIIRHLIIRHLIKQSDIQLITKNPTYSTKTSAKLRPLR
ncbi:hypothetical protein Hanom_Chr03g00184851 [Helianthus anomalus]